MALRSSAGATTQKILQISRAFSSAITSNSASPAVGGATERGTSNLHMSARQQYPVAQPLPLPQNVDASETTRFTHERNRDLACAAIVSHHTNLGKIDVTVDSTPSAEPTAVFTDPHLELYDTHGPISVHCVMQSSVPQPLGGMHKFSHLNMPGGQWSQEGKFMAQNLQDSHYTNLRQDARSNWSSYDQQFGRKGTGNFNIFQSNKCFSYLNNSPLFSSLTNPLLTNGGPLTTRSYSSQADATTSSSSSSKPLTKKEQLKKAFKDYGSTVIVFHVGISLMSLGGFYALVSSGVNLMPFVDAVGLGSSALSDKIAGASTFVIAYAVHKVFAPVRISITLGSLPFIVRFLRNRGWLKVKKQSPTP